MIRCPREETTGDETDGVVVEAKVFFLNVVFEIIRAEMSGTEVEMAISSGGGLHRTFDGSLLFGQDHDPSAVLLI
jgi:hypothetical protein